ncbi:MAG: response regulator [Verrucomicrobiales bacterium]|nr:response regulator [Verrucomicrobiales bacterium]
MNDVGGARILVIDDTPENLQVVSAVLRGAGYTVNVAKSGEQGLEIARRLTPNLVLLDLVMPGMDGFATCRALREVGALAEVPVIFLTASRDTTDVVRGFEEGAVDYVTKPFHAAELLSRVQTHVQLRLAREKLATLAGQLARYLSPQVHAKIFSGEREVRRETRRRPLTVFFSDIVGFTARTEAMGDAELAAWLNDYLDQMAQVAQRYGGTVDKFIGDAVMVFFGDPTSAGLEEDARRCLRMAGEMLEVARTCRTEIRIGVHSGECVVGNFGSEEQMNYTIIGKVVNAAARLQGASAPGRILVSEDVRRLAGEVFQYEPRGPIALRGMAMPMDTFWVAGAETFGDPT